MELEFVRASKEKDYISIYEHTNEAFSDSPDFKWTLEEIKQEVKDGWELYAVYFEQEIIAALFCKVDKNALLTKNTAIKMQHQGSGFSHKIKHFFEEKAMDLKLDKIIHYCRIDNFRMYSLNESHKYKKIQEGIGDDKQLVIWEKTLTKKTAKKHKKNKK